PSHVQPKVLPSAHRWRGPHAPWLEQAKYVDASHLETRRSYSLLGGAIVSQHLTRVERSAPARAAGRWMDNARPAWRIDIQRSQRKSIRVQEFDGVPGGGSVAPEPERN